MDGHGRDDRLLKELHLLAHLFAEHGRLDKAQEIREAVLQMEAQYSVGGMIENIQDGGEDTGP